jgi:uncharacterized CHY-type Zn-finger protein
VEDEEGIKNYFAAFHLHDTFPAAVVVDDFGDLFEQRYVFCLSCKKCIEIFKFVILKRSFFFEFNLKICYW